MTIGISIREFARREGCSHTLVNRAVKQGRIKTLEDGSLNPSDVGTPWKQSNAVRGNKRGNTGASVSSHGASPRKDVSSSELPSVSAPDDDSLADQALSILTERGATLDYGEALRVKENFLALLRELEYRQKSGALIELAAAQAAFFDTFRAQRDAWLNWPVKVGPVLAADLGIDASDRVTELLTAHVHKQIEQLGEPESGLPAGEAQ